MSSAAKVLAAQAAWRDRRRALGRNMRGVAARRIAIVINVTNIGQNIVVIALSGAHALIATIAEKQSGASGNLKTAVAASSCLSPISKINNLSGKTGSCLLIDFLVTRLCCARQKPASGALRRGANKRRESSTQ